MNFRTEFDPQQLRLPQPISYKDSLLLMGSCFAENIGAKLKNIHYDLIINPFGITYNPASMAAQLNRLAMGGAFEPKDLFQDGDLFLSFWHHSRFAAGTEKAALAAINTAFDEGCVYYKKSDFWILTLGTAWVYSLLETGGVVNNCHRRPARDFSRARLGVGEIVEALQAIFEMRPNVRIILTVSPVRHLKDGFHGNQISKSTLLLACERLAELLPERVFYFPAYEIMMDDLRDYRFYADDMTHPSAAAVEYIWSIFEAHYLAADEAGTRRKIADLERAAAHRPFNPQTSAHQNFVQQQLAKLDNLAKNWPNLSFGALRQRFENQLINNL